VTLLTVEVDQHVKGDIGRALVVRSPRGSDVDVDVSTNQAYGWLLSRAPDGTWLASSCSVVRPGFLVAEGGEPRGGAIKVVLGMGILALVLLWALRRKRKGVRPNLPGAPQP
jgi:MYXO-CTERM domain-containing protein